MEINTQKNQSILNMGSYSLLSQQVPSIPDFEGTGNTVFWQSNLKGSMVGWHLEDSSITKALLYVRMSFATYKAQRE